jgi:shikimate kinase
MGVRGLYMIITLIGMPATGKSTFGRKLAKKLAYEFIDLDVWISTHEQKSIPEIFAQKGEEYFRKLESQALKEVLKGDYKVIALGGGTPCFFDNMLIINEKSISIYLYTSLEGLLTRITRDTAQSRPLFKAQSLEETHQKITNLYAQRRSFYEQAKIKLDLE